MSSKRRGTLNRGIDTTLATPAPGSSFVRSAVRSAARITDHAHTPANSEMHGRIRREAAVTTHMEVVMRALRQKVRLTWLVASVLVLIGPLSSAAQTPPLTYNAMTDRLVHLMPALLTLGGAGFQFTDPTFGSKMLRVTDANTRPDRVGRFFMSPSSAESTAWNTNSTKFYVMGSGGEQIPYNFNPATMTSSRMAPLGNGSGGLVLNFNGEPTFSFVDPDLIYSGSGSQFVSYRFSTAIQTALHDVGSCLPGITLHALNVSISKDDQQFLAYIGGASQDADTTVYVYDKTKGCRWMNTQTGQVGGQWGPTGAYTGDKSLTLHNARLSKGGQFARLVTSNGGAGTYYWDIGTLNLVACPENVGPNYCNGHAVMGFTKAINQRQVGDGMDFAIRPMSTPNSATLFPGLISPLLTPAQWVVDTHPSWNNVQSDEKQPVCMEVYRTDNIVQRAWDGEIICAAMDGSFKVWRFAHHRSNVANLFWDQPRANVSQDGRFVMFTSNWGGTVGTGPDGARQDAFIVQLAAGSTTPASSPTNLTLQ